TEAITQAGGTVRLADVSDTTFCMTAESLEAACTPATRFVIPVPIYGNPAGLPEIVDFARERGLRVVVDAAQAHGARLHGKRLGEVADVATYSFFPGKNLGAYGDAGAVTTNDDETARAVRMWRNHGREGKFDHQFEGVNSRMDGLQGAILRAKLLHLDSWCEGRRQVAAWYREALAGIEGLRLPKESDGAEHVYHLYVVRASGRDGLRGPLKERGVASGVHYPDPVHLTAAYAHLGHGRGAFPASEEICDTVLSLPIYPELRRDQVDRVADALRDLLSTQR
ncbi:MAG: DegT/DnrJ/EryC1/StrS family aminotransferase, partial [Acidobacteriota bacterium]|nr:DegT/DnrJ/EryC1/StrS family aminotransferase [Acidobacteriota bacterium]